METLNNLIGEQTYMVADHHANRFNFCGLITVDELFCAEHGLGVKYPLTDHLPEDVQRAVGVMVENDVKIEDFTGIVVFKDGEETIYLLTW